MKRYLMLLAMLAGLAGCGHPGRDPSRLAAQGLIDDNAPMQAEAEIVINAEPEKIWALLTEVNRWPAWQPDISNASMQAAPGVGAEFTWHTGGVDIQSRMQRFVPQTALAWTGQAYFITAIHVWNISALSKGRCVLRTKESMSGALLSWFYSALKLQESDQRWLASLKRQAEA